MISKFKLWFSRNNSKIFIYILIFLFIYLFSNGIDNYYSERNKKRAEAMTERSRRNSIQDFSGRDLNEIDPNEINVDEIDGKFKKYNNKNM